MFVESKDMIIYVDIDETICYHEDDDSTKAREYENAKPYTERIEKINSLYDEGNTIVYWTARGSVTGLDWTDLTKMQLEKLLHRSTYQMPNDRIQWASAL